MKRPHFALPEIYDESLSYYDVLRKLIKSIHVINDNLNKIPEQIANEAKARLLSDQNLQQNINSEATTRERADQEIRECVSDKIIELKGDLANKLPKSPANWETWTAEEQVAARERMGVAGYELIVDVPTLETASNFHITLDSNGNALALKAVAIDFAGAADGSNCLIEINNGYLKCIASLAAGRFGSFVGVPLGNDYYCYYCTNGAPDRNQPNPNSSQFMAGVKADTIINNIWFRGTVPAGASIQIYGIRG